MYNKAFGTYTYTTGNKEAVPVTPASVYDLSLIHISMCISDRPQAFQIFQRHSVTLPAVVQDVHSFPTRRSSDLIDIGGTNTVFGIVDARGTILASGSTASRPGR